MMRFILVFLVILWTAPLLAANCGTAGTSYYVDFSAANDTGAGTQVSPWKYAPGDSAKGAGNCTLQAGDVVIFKKGVSYLNQIANVDSGSLVTSGTTGSVTSGGTLTDTAKNFTTAGVVPGDYIYIFHSKASVTNTWVESTGLFVVATVGTTSLTMTSYTGVTHSTAEMTYRIIRPITYKSVVGWGTGEATFDGTTNSLEWAFLPGTPGNFTRFEGLKFINYPYVASDWNSAIYGGTDTHVVNCIFGDIATKAGINNSVNGGNYTVMQGNTVAAWEYYALNAETSLYSLYENNTATGYYSTPGANTRGGARYAQPKSYNIFRYNTLSNANTDNTSGRHSNGFYIDEGDSPFTSYFWIYGNTLRNSSNIFFITNGSTPENKPHHGVIHSNVVIGDYSTTGVGI